MFQFPSIPPRKVWIPALAALVPWWDPAGAQNFSMMVTDPNPLGLGNFVPGMEDLELDLTAGIKGDFDYGFGLTSVYNSNFFLTEDHEQGELTTSFLPWLRYVSDPEGGAKISFTANYAPTILTYLENPALNGWNQNGDVALTFQGAKTSLALFGRYSQISGTDILTGTHTTGTVMTGGIRANRQIAPRTSLNASWTAAMSDYSSGDNVGSNVYTTYVGGFWQATERLSFGPAIRNTISESDNTGTNDAWALLIQAQYRMGERIWLAASIGPQYSTNSENGGNQGSFGLTGDLSATYVINERWTWTSSIVQATVPSPNETNNLVNNLTINTALNRHLLRGSLSGGLTFNYSNYEDVGPDGSSGTLGNQENLSLFLGYSRNLISERVGFNSMIRYLINSGQTDWTQLELTAGLTLAF